MPGAKSKLTRNPVYANYRKCSHVPVREITEILGIVWKKRGDSSGSLVSVQPPGLHGLLVSQN